MRDSDCPGRLPRAVRHARRSIRLSHLLPIAALALLGTSTPARADGCLVLLCLAAPSWRAIPQCVAPIRELFRDLARGRPFPTCAMAGAGNSARNRWAHAPDFCPPQYTRVLDGDAGPVYTCDFSGCVSVTINGALFARTWWNFGGETVTEFAPSAKATLGNWDTRYDDDFARWLASQPPPAPAPADTNGGY